jgi:hypothetical protein
MAPEIKPFHAVHLISQNSFALISAMGMPGDLVQEAML